MKIREVWYVPALYGPEMKKPVMYYDFRSRLKKFAILNTIDNSYGGKHDWPYRYRLGWRIVKMTMTGALKTK